MLNSITKKWLTYETIISKIGEKNNTQSEILIQLKDKLTLAAIDSLFIVFLVIVIRADTTIYQNTGPIIYILNPDKIKRKLG